ncbi:hypothetical protein, partial [Picosynechococcus sp. PCC 7002]|uniref:hypothetical protein n=1 Tax=Picosynechococcus sp. (strain ATCC 27264 / PCC 7002 / PR-6) TaxID=32049 RepID=UPI001C3CD904
MKQDIASGGLMSSISVLSSFPSFLHVLLTTFERMVYFLNISSIGDYLPFIFILNTLHHVVC